MDALGSVVDPADVQWVATHPDRDHTGALFDLLEAAPDAGSSPRSSVLGAMSTERPIPMDRLYLLNPGQSVEVGDRTMHRFPTTALRQPRHDRHLRRREPGACFSSDCFGAPAARPAASGRLQRCPRKSTADQLRSAQLLWATVDSPWVQTIDPAKYLQTMTPLRAMDPTLILSTHLPPAPARLPEFLEMPPAAPQADPFIGPDQRALEAMLAEFEPSAGR